MRHRAAVLIALKLRGKSKSEAGGVRLGGGRLCQDRKLAHNLAQLDGRSPKPALDAVEQFEPGGKG